MKTVMLYLAVAAPVVGLAALRRRIQTPQQKDRFEDERGGAGSPAQGSRSLSG